MVYATDRDRVAAAIFPALLSRWYRRVIEMTIAEGLTPNSADKQTQDLLTAAEAAAYQGLDDKRTASVMRRVIRLRDQIMGPYEDGALIKAFLMLAYAMGHLIDDGRMVLLDGSPLAVAYDTIADTVAEHAPLIAGADKSASKAARKLCDLLASEGVM